MAETQVLGWGTQDAPADRTTKDREDFTVLAITATFDGTAAASSFLPCVEIISDAGVTVQRTMTNSAVSAGSSAEVTFAPFLSRGTNTPAPIYARYHDTRSVAPWPASTRFEWALTAGTALLDLTAPAHPLTLFAGAYFLQTSITTVGLTAGASLISEVGDGGFGAGFASTIIQLGNNNDTNALNLGMNQILAVGDFLFVDVWHDQAAAVSINQNTDIILFPSA